ncbi:hypothetical protein CCP3SC5AM1_420006 [Gammaproteobacteria bacterium]
MAKLMLNLGSLVLKEIILVKEITTIGRGNDNDIVLDNLSASSHHARVIKAGDKYAVEDLASTNGTLVNSQKVERKVLEEDDIIAIGKHELRFIEETSKRVETPADFEKTVFVRSPSSAPSTSQSPLPVVQKISDAVPIKSEKGGIVKIIAVVVAVLAAVVVGYIFLKIQR